MQIPLIKGDKVSPDVDYRDALPVNMHAVEHEIKGANGYMRQWYGLSHFANGQGASRGARWVTAEGLEGHYRVSGGSLIKISSAGVVTVLGEIQGDEQCSIAFSFNNVAIVGGGNLYYYNPSSGLRQITNPLAGEPIDIVWADGLFILTDGTDLYHSEALDEESFLPADFGNAQFRPDMTNGLGLNEDNELIAFGVTTLEYFTNQGASAFQYLRIQLKALKLGVMGTHCRKELNGKWYILGRREESSPAIHFVQGGGSEVVSTREIDKLLASYSQSDLGLATIDTFSRDDINFVQVNLPSHTLLFNESIAETMGVGVAWSILKSDVLGEQPFRGKDYILDGASSVWTCGDRIDGRVGIIDESVGTQYGDIAEWELFSPLVKLESLSIDQIEMEIIPGFSLDNDATVFMSLTTDGDFYGAEYTINYGDNYAYNNRFIAFALGYVRHFVGWKFRGATRSRMAFALLNVEAS